MSERRGRGRQRTDGRRRRRRTQSQPASSMALISAPRLAKSAERIEGDTITSSLLKLSTTLPARGATVRRLALLVASAADWLRPAPASLLVRLITLVAFMVFCFVPRCCCVARGLAPSPRRKPWKPASKALASRRSKDREIPFRAAFSLFASVLAFPARACPPFHV